MRLSVVTMAYAVGPISGAQFHPAETMGLSTVKRSRWREVPAYVTVQVVAVVAALTLAAVANGKSGVVVTDSGLAGNRYGERSPGSYSLPAVLVAEVVLTAFFAYIILGVIDHERRRDPRPLWVSGWPPS